MNDERVATETQRQPRLLPSEDGSEEKVCRRCFVRKPATKFTITRPNRSAPERRRNICNRCRHKLPGYQRHAKAYAAMSGAKKIEARLRFMKERSITCCEICGSDNELHVDHDHDTGEGRGLLCLKCNVGIGFFRDRPDFMNAAAAYVTRTGR